MPANTLSIDIVHGTHQRALVQQCHHVCANLPAAPKVLVQHGRSLAQQRGSRDEVEGFRIGDIHGDNLCTQPFGFPNRTVVKRLNVRMETIEEEVVRHTDTHAVERGIARPGGTKSV